MSDLALLLIGVGMGLLLSCPFWTCWPQTTTLTDADIGSDDEAVSITFNFANKTHTRMYLTKSDAAGLAKAILSEAE